MPTTTMYRLRTVFTGIAGMPGVQTTYFQAEGFDPAQVATELETTWQGLSAVMNDALVARVQETIDEVDPITGNIVAQHQASTNNIVGQDGLQLLSLGTQGLEILNTGVFVGGRQIQGKFYVPAPTEGSNDLGVVQSAYGNSMQANVQALVQQALCNLVVYSPTYGRWENIAAHRPSTYWARIRSRQR